MPPPSFTGEPSKHKKRCYGSYKKINKPTGTRKKKMLIGLNEVHEQISKDEARRTRSYARKMKKADANEEEEEYEEPLIDKRRKQRPLKMDDTCPTHSCFRFRATNLACDTKKSSELRSEDKSALAGLEKQSTIVLTDDDDDM
ncbi:hypothetical protein QJS10_CPB22g01162 [Acorus calamus]|uniref:Uncharacterized protein n=1 Tax=Acorus calamus TaxID=4465 RepID=A0AAV9C230_ACOCL|nr:hypothetical protein QJS10_CPB22g01162 [Acorus calamus]